MIQTPEQLALHQILDIYARLPDGTPAAWLDLTQLLLVNVFYKIDGWDSVAQRTVVAEQLHGRLLRDLAMLDLPDAQVMGHG